MIKAGIYKIENKINGKKYIGSSFDVFSRIKQHRRALKKRKHNNSHLQNAINKYGLENFKFEVLEIILIKDKELLNKRLKGREAFYIKLYKSFKDGYGYNKLSPESGRKITNEQTSRKISEAGKGRAAWNKGKIGIYSEERLNRIKEARAKQVMPKWTAERYEKMKNKMPTNKGLPAHNRRKVIQLDAEMNVINIFDSLKEAALKTGAAHSNIGGCCKNPNRTSGGFKWMYEVDYKNQLIECLLSA